MEELVQKRLRHIFNDDHIIFDKSRFAGGLTNYNYIMEINGRDYVIRQPGGMTSEMIVRKNEAVNNRITSEIGLNCECIYFDEISGIKVSVYLDDSKNIATLDPGSPYNIKLVSSLMKKIHYSDRTFSNTFHWQLELSKYEKLVSELKGDFFYDYFILKNKLIDYMGKHINCTILLPCHNDTVPENFILNSSGKAYLIDWEYSGMNDPDWDVAAYILESKLNKESILNLLLEYYGQYPAAEEELKIKCYMIAQDLLWTVWALIRHYNGDDFRDYCYFRYERFRKNIRNLPHIFDYPIAKMVEYKS